MTRAGETCRSCGVSGMDQFFSIDRVPVGSCVLLDDRTAARRYPSGRIDLAVCHGCGLIQNVSFDEALVDYTSGYEESQGYSATFLAYADALIAQLDARYGLSDATVVEPGCGKGEFLVRLCEATGARGIGIDPAHVVGRIDTDADVQFVKELFTARTDHTGDVVLCRHTLEHISDVAGFLNAMRTSASRTPDSVVVVEVPDTRRVLDEGAFWDVYYEHASYFTPVSLRCAAQVSGLRSLALDSWFDDQYLVIEAQIGESGHDTPDPDAVRRVVSAASRFAETVSESIDQWTATLNGAKRPVLWGASSKAVGFLAAVDVPNLVATVDINPYKQGSFLAGSGAEIVGPDRLPELDTDLVVVMNPIYTDEIRASIESLGLSPSVVAC